jgi:FATC domain
LEGVGVDVGVVAHVSMPQKYASFARDRDRRAADEAAECARVLVYIRALVAVESLRCPLDVGAQRFELPLSALLQQADELLRLLPLRMQNTATAQQCSTLFEKLCTQVRGDVSALEQRAQVAREESVREAERTNARRAALSLALVEFSRQRAPLDQYAVAVLPLLGELLSLLSGVAAQAARASVQKLYESASAWHANMLQTVSELAAERVVAAERSGAQLSALGAASDDSAPATDDVTVDEYTPAGGWPRHTAAWLGLAKSLAQEAADTRTPDDGHAQRLVVRGGAGRFRAAVAGGPAALSAVAEWRTRLPALEEAVTQLVSGRTAVHTSLTTLLGVLHGVERVRQEEGYAGAINAHAVKVLQCVQAKLEGRWDQAFGEAGPSSSLHGAAGAVASGAAALRASSPPGVLSEGELTRRLIAEATDEQRLACMFEGWLPHY